MILDYVVPAMSMECILTDVRYITCNQNVIEYKITANISV